MMQPAQSAERQSEHTGDAGLADRTPSGIEHVVAGLLREGGVARVLRYLNTRTRYRFTGIYHVEPPRLRNVFLFDRENPALDCSGAVTRLDDTYCSITAGTSAPFATGNSGRDPRLRAHPARDSVLCYAGVPIRLASGAIWGSLCHFDLRPRLLIEAELGVLEAVAPALAQWIGAGEGQRPPS